MKKVVQEASKKEIFDRKKLKASFRTQTAITMADYKCLKTENMSNEEFYDSFKEQLIKILRKKKIIKVEERIKYMKRYTNISRLIMKRKRADPEEIRRINKAIKETIRGIKTKRFNKFIEKGCKHSITIRRKKHGAG